MLMYREWIPIEAANSQDHREVPLRLVRCDDSRDMTRQSEPTMSAPIYQVVSPVAHPELLEEGKSH